MLPATSGCLGWPGRQRLVSQGPTSWWATWKTDRLLFQGGCQVGGLWVSQQPGGAEHGGKGLTRRTQWFSKRCTVNDPETVQADDRKRVLLRYVQQVEPSVIAEFDDTADDDVRPSTCQQDLLLRHLEL